MSCSLMVTAERNFSDWQECYKNLAEYLTREKKVCQGYFESILERERSFPTGLQITPEIGIAIPHSCNPDLTLDPAIAVSILKNPIEVNSMGQPDEKIKVSVVLMLALVGAESHLNLLQSMMETFQDEDFLHTIIDTEDPQIVTSLLTEKLRINS